MSKKKKNPTHQGQHSSRTGYETGSKLNPAHFATRVDHKALQTTVQQIRAEQQQQHTKLQKAKNLSVALSIAAIFAALFAGASDFWQALVTHQVAERSQQATLAIVSAYMDPIRPGSKPPNVILTIKNVGGGGADITQEGVYAIIPNLPPGPMPDYLRDYFAGPNRRTDVFRGTNHMERDQTDQLLIAWINAAPITQLEFNKISSGEWKFFVIVQIRYVSRGESRVAEFCGFWVPTRERTLLLCDKWNGARKG